MNDLSVTPILPQPQDDELGIRFAELVRVFGKNMPRAKREKAWRQIYEILRQFECETEEAAGRLELWTNTHYDDATAELQAWADATQEMLNRRKKIFEQIDSFLDHLNESLDEEDQRDSMVQLLINLAEREVE